MKAYFDVMYMEEAWTFIMSQPEKVREKIVYNIHKSRYFIDVELFKKLENSDIWEFRTRYHGNCYRLLAFWDNESNALIVATHGFMKKTNKTPAGEIIRAEAYRKQYFESKK